MRKAPSQARTASAKADLSLPTVARSCSMKWASCQRARKRSCYGCSRKVSLSVSAVRARSKSRVGALGRITANYLNRFRRGGFRENLFYRLNVYPITIPSLRERREDIPLLVTHYAREIGERLGKNISEVPAQVMREFTGYNWPGNIRELQNVIERAVIVSSDGVLRLP